MSDCKTDAGTSSEADQTAPERKELTPEARRALAEAEERRRSEECGTQTRPKEINGRDGPDPARYGDWEKDGIISDF